MCVCVCWGRVSFVSCCSRRLLSVCLSASVFVSLSLSSRGKSSGALLAHDSNDVGCPLEALPPARARARGGPFAGAPARTTLALTTW